MSAARRKKWEAKEPAASEPQEPAKREWRGKLGTINECKEPSAPEATEMRRDIIPERYFSQPAKEKAEMSAIEECGDREQILYEHRWSKTAREDIAEIESKIDSMFRGLPERPKEMRAHRREEEVRVETPSFIASRAQPAPPSWVDLPITGTIIDRRVLYRTAGGYLIEVVYRAPDGTLKTDRFSVTSVGDVESALDKLRQGAPHAQAAQPAPAAEEKAQEAQPQEEKKAEGKTEEPSGKAGKKGFAVPLLFGKKKQAPPAEKEDAPKAEAAPGPAVEPAAPREQVEEPKKRKGLDIGGLAGKLPFGKKKQQ